MLTETEACDIAAQLVTAKDVAAVVAKIISNDYDLFDAVIGGAHVGITQRLNREIAARNNAEVGLIIASDVMRGKTPKISDANKRTFWRACANTLFAAGTTFAAEAKKLAEGD